jgi:hypothetical protein
LSAYLRSESGRAFAKQQAHGVGRKGLKIKRFGLTDRTSIGNPYAMTRKATGWQLTAWRSIL